MSKKIVLGSVVASTVLASSSAFAADASPITTAINSAVTAANGNVTAVVLGVIGIAAIGFGVGMIVSYLRR